MSRMLIGVLSVLLSTSLLAQDPAAGRHTLTGTVTDTAGATLLAVAVELFTADGERRGQTLTDAEGVFRFTGLAPGSYALALRLPGFAVAAATAEVGATGGELTAMTTPIRMRPEGAGTTTVPSPSGRAALGSPPGPRVVCGMTLFGGGPNTVDPKIEAPRPPAGAPTVKGTIRALEPPMCWEPTPRLPRVEPPQGAPAR